MKKKVLLVGAVLLLLCSCSAQQKDEYAQKSSEDIVMSPVSQAYSGYEEILGKDYGNIKMPDKITKADIDEVYRFKARLYCSEDKQAQAEAGKKMFSAFYGDDYSEENCGFDEYNYRYIYTKNNRLLGACENASFYADREDLEPSKLAEYVECYPVKGNEDKVITLCNNESCKVSEIASCAMNFIDDHYSPLLEGFTIEPQDVFARKYGDENIGYVHFAYKYKGVQMEAYPSHYYKEYTSDDGKQMSNSFIVTNTCAFVDGKDKLLGINIDNQREVTKETALSEMISLKDAAELAAKELAPNSEYVVDDIKLMYCSLNVYPTVNAFERTIEEQIENAKKSNKIEKEFYPTWVFICNNDFSGFGRYSIKVNAVTGEIIIDAEENIAG